MIIIAQHCRGDNININTFGKQIRIRTIKPQAASAPLLYWFLGDSGRKNRQNECWRGVSFILPERRDYLPNSFLNLL